MISAQRYEPALQQSEESGFLRCATGQTCVSALLRIISQLIKS